MNNFNNNQNYGYGMYPNMGGTQYGQFAQAKMTQPLTPEQMRELRSTGSGFSLKVDPVEILRSHCTHKENGNIALTRNGDGSSTCTVCGATFNLVDKEPIEIEEITKAVLDVLQSIKTYYVDIPENYVKDYFTIIPYLEKLPKFYEVAIHNFAKYENGSFLNNNNNMYGFQMLSALTSPGYGQMGTGMMGGAPMGQPNMYQPQQPMGGYMNPQIAYGQPMQPQMGTNPFGSVQAQPMQPQMGYGQPMQPQQQAPVTNEAAQPQAQQTPTTGETGQQPQVISTKSFNL